MNFLYPKVSSKALLFSAKCALLGAVIGGLYGAAHDQVSYTISREYFTKLKFHQFAYANFHLHPRVFAAEVGFLASWWVGMIAGWLMGRGAYDPGQTARLSARMGKAFAILVGATILAGAAAALIGVLKTGGSGINAWADVSIDLLLDEPRSFAIVAYLHAGSYLGAIIGLIAAVIYVNVARRKHAVISNP